MRGVCSYLHAPVPINGKNLINKKRIGFFMKLCRNCSCQLPDNFITCSNCGAPLPSESAAGSQHMQLFMYNAQMGKKIGTGKSLHWLLNALLVLIFVFIIIIPIQVVVTQGDVNSVVITMLIWFGIMVAAIIVGIICANKLKDSYTAYIYFNGILYKETLHTSKVMMGGGRSSLLRLIVILNNYKRIKELEAKSANPGTYLELFAKYTNGEKLWDPIFGGEVKIDALRNFRITGETNKQYNYTYIDEKGEIKCSTLPKCYPYIESIFTFCK